MGMGSRELKVDPQDLCAIGRVGWNRGFSAADLVDQRSPRLSPRAAKTLLRRLVYGGVLKKDGRGKFTPTPAGWRVIEQAASSCRR